MWGFSFDDIARRAQEEAAKLAEQASSLKSPGFLNLDSMNPEHAKSSSSLESRLQPTIHTPQSAVHASSTQGSSLIGTPSSTWSNTESVRPNTEPFPAKRIVHLSSSEKNEDNSHPVTPLVSNVISPLRNDTAVNHPDHFYSNIGSLEKDDSIHEFSSRPTVTKLTKTEEKSDDDFDPDAWGDEENNNDSMVEESEEVVEHAKKESKKMVDERMNEAAPPEEAHVLSEIILPSDLGNDNQSSKHEESLEQEIIAEESVDGEDDPFVADTYSTTIDKKQLSFSFIETSIGEDMASKCPQRCAEFIPPELNDADRAKDRFSDDDLLHEEPCVMTEKSSAIHKVKNEVDDSLRMKDIENAASQALDETNDHEKQLYESKFDEPLNVIKHDEPVIEKCQLEVDLKQFPARDIMRTERLRSPDIDQHEKETVDQSRMKGNETVITHSDQNLDQDDSKIDNATQYVKHLDVNKDEKLLVEKFNMLGDFSELIASDYSMTVDQQNLEIAHLDEKTTDHCGDKHIEVANLLMEHDSPKECASISEEPLDVNKSDERLVKTNDFVEVSGEVEAINIVRAIREKKIDWEARIPETAASASNEVQGDNNFQLEHEGESVIEKYQVMNVANSPLLHDESAFITQAEIEKTGLNEEVKSVEIAQLEGTRKNDVTCDNPYTSPGSSSSASCVEHHSDCLTIQNYNPMETTVEVNEKSNNISLSESPDRKDDSALDGLGQQESEPKVLEAGSKHSEQWGSSAEEREPNTGLISLFQNPTTKLLEASTLSIFSWTHNTDISAKSSFTEESEIPKSKIDQDIVVDENTRVEQIPYSDVNVNEALDRGEMNDLYNDDALDDMYDDDEESNEGLMHQQVPSAGVGDKTEHDIKSRKSDPEVIESEGSLHEDISKNHLFSDNVPQYALEKFVKQLERITESNQLEMDELHRSYKLEINRLENELLTERSERKKIKAKEDVAMQDKYLVKMRDLERDYNKILGEKDKELTNVIKRNEGITLKMDSMKREIDGLLNLVEKRDDEICKLKKGHGNSMMKVEDKVKVNEEELARKDAEIQDLKSSVSTLQYELDTTSEAFNTLKIRAKAIATELKDRRVEVRTLSSRNEELTSMNTSLETQLTNIQALIKQHELTISYKENDYNALNEKVKELNKQIEDKDKLLQDRNAVGEKAISSYKRKAQEALAASNARLAAANQAKEEAESDAKAAKLASDDALTLARLSETKAADAEQCARESSNLLEAERTASSKIISELRKSMAEMESKIQIMQSEAEEANMEKERLVADLIRIESEMNVRQSEKSKLSEKLIEEKARCSSLQNEISYLQNDIQRSSAAAFKRQKDETLSAELPATMNGKTIPSTCGGNANDQIETDGTIIMLQQELQGANEAITELKIALQTALLEKAELHALDGKTCYSTNALHQDYTSLDAVHGNESTPLFFAIEKQNELNTARDEINRLANMLGDAESEKQQAFEAMEKMRLRMDDANARLLRYEKLGMKSNRPTIGLGGPSNYTALRGTNQSSLFADSHNVQRTSMTNENDSIVNLEYLKNVILSFLKAKTLSDRRKLVPVIATVLCLTPEEQSQAVHSVEENAGLTGVASSFWENLESKAHKLL